jgi:hypothetical protein
LEAGSAFRVPTFRNYTLVNPQVGSPRDLGVRHIESDTCPVLEGEKEKCSKLQIIVALRLKYGHGRIASS